MDCGKACRCESYRAHLLSVGFAATAMPTRRPLAASIEASQVALAKDAPAYRRLRKDGIQPKGVDGCARLEARANHLAEVETGRLVSDLPGRT